MVGRGVSTKYTMRSPAMYEKIAQYIITFVQGKIGNYLVFFPSYQMMAEIQGYLLEKTHFTIYVQSNSMTEEEREEFL